MPGHVFCPGMTITRQPGNFLHLRQSSRITLGGEHNSLEKFLSGLSVEKWMKYLSSPDEMEDKITLPRFTFEDDAGFKNVPSALGMEVAFDQERAGFGSMNPVGPAGICPSNT